MSGHYLSLWFSAGCLRGLTPGFFVLQPFINSFRCILQWKTLHHSLFLHSSSSLFTLVASIQHLERIIHSLMALKRSYKIRETSPPFLSREGMMDITCRRIFRLCVGRSCRRHSSTSDIYTDNVPPPPLCRHCIPAHNT